MASEETMQDSEASPAQPVERIFTSAERISCDGGGGPLGHPIVWLTLGTGDEITCPYCSRQFVRRVDDDDDWE